MSLQMPSIYHKMQSVFALFEEGKLKGQKARDLTGLNFQKALEGKFAPKLHHFKIFQGIDVSVSDYKFSYDIVDFDKYRMLRKRTS